MRDGKRIRAYRRISRERRLRLMIDIIELADIVQRILIGFGAILAVVGIVIICIGASSEDIEIIIKTILTGAGIGVISVPMFWIGTLIESFVDKLMEVYTYEI